MRIFVGHDTFLRSGPGLLYLPAVIVSARILIVENYLQTHCSSVNIMLWSRCHRNPFRIQSILPACVLLPVFFGCTIALMSLAFYE